MKRSSCIQSIKNQLNAKISAHTNSDRDFIVFKPKSYIFNPILTKQNHNNMTSIFQLENKRKKQSSFMIFKLKSNQKFEKKEAFENHLMIQKCKTSKKFRLNNNRIYNSYKPFQIGTPRSKSIKTSTEKISQLRNTGSLRSEKRVDYQKIIRLQKKKNFDSLIHNSNNTKISSQKQNETKNFNFRRLKQISNEQLVDSNYLNLFKERTTENQKLRLSLNRVKQTHKKIFTEIPSILLSKSHDRLLAKQNKTFLLDRSSVELKKHNDQNNGFQPWQTGEFFYHHEEISGQ